MNFNLRIILHVCFIFILYLCAYLYSALIWIHDYALNKNRCYYYYYCVGVSLSVVLLYGSIAISPSRRFSLFSLTRLCPDHFYIITNDGHTTIVMFLLLVSSHVVQVKVRSITVRVVTHVWLVLRCRRPP